MSGHLLGRAALEDLAAEAEVDGLVRRLRDGPWDVGLRGAYATPAVLDLSIRRAAAARLATLGKWAGPRIRRLAILFQDEDRRSIRALLRGAVGGVRPEARLAGLIPTAELPERALEELARQSTAAKVATLLVAWGNPYGSAVFEHATQTQPDLFAIELELARTFARRAGRSARGSALRSFVRNAIDVENCASAVALAGHRIGARIDGVFLEGGARLGRDGFTHAARAEDADRAIGRLARHVGVRTPFGVALMAATPATLEKSLLRWRVASQRRLARLRPLGPALLLAWALRLRAEVMDLRTITWGVALRAPRPLLVDELVTS